MKYQLILASESPRRKQLLENAGYKFHVHPSKISEILRKNLNVEEQILDLARQKARAVFTALKTSLPPSVQGPFLVLGSDTEVIFGGKPLGKPKDPQDARRILRSLSGQEHVVITAMWVIESQTGQESGTFETSRVRFKDLSDQEIWSYVQTGDPLDKAGAYGIQGPGRELIAHFDGTLENIMGLPVQRLQELLKEKTWEVHR